MKLKAKLNTTVGDRDAIASSFADACACSVLPVNPPDDSDSSTATVVSTGKRKWMQMQQQQQQQSKKQEKTRPGIGSCMPRILQHVDDDDDIDEIHRCVSDLTDLLVKRAFPPSLDAKKKEKITVSSLPSSSHVNGTNTTTKVATNTTKTSTNVGTAAFAKYHHRNIGCLPHSFDDFAEENSTTSTPAAPAPIITVDNHLYGCI